MCATFSHTAYLINSYYLCIKDFSLMRTLLIYIIFAFAGLSCYAQTESENTDTVSAIDTVYIYTNWKSIVNHDPVAAYSGPIIISTMNLRPRFSPPTLNHNRWLTTKP